MARLSLPTITVTAFLSLVPLGLVRDCVCSPSLDISDQIPSNSDFYLFQNGADSAGLDVSYENIFVEKFSLSRGGPRYRIYPGEVDGELNRLVPEGAVYGSFRKVYPSGINETLSTGDPRGVIEVYRFQEQIFAGREWDTRDFCSDDSYNPLSNLN